MCCWFAAERTMTFCWIGWLCCCPLPGWLSIVIVIVDCGCCCCTRLWDCWMCIVCCSCWDAAASTCPPIIFMPIGIGTCCWPCGMLLPWIWDCCWIDECCVIVDEYVVVPVVVNSDSWDSYTISRTTFVLFIAQWWKTNRKLTEAQKCKTTQPKKLDFEHIKHFHRILWNPSYRFKLLYCID